MSPAKKNTNQSTSIMSDRLLALHGGTNDPQPYPITDDITVAPLDRSRTKALKAAELKKFFAQQVLSRRAAATISSQPPVLPEDATDEQHAEYDEALKAWTAAFDLDTIQHQIDEAEDEYYRAFFGAAHDAVMTFFEDKPALWDKFIPDIEAEFLPSAPDDGICPTCGHVDEDQAGKAPEPSTSSTTTGT